MTIATGAVGARRRGGLAIIGVALLSVGLVAACSSDKPAGSSPAASVPAASGAAPSAPPTSGSTAGTAAGPTASGDTGGRGSVADLALTPEQIAKAKAAGAGQTVGIVAPLSAEYLASVVDGAKQVAGQLGVKADVFDYQFEAAKGVTGIETFVSQGVKYLIVVLTDPNSMIGAVKQAESKGVTVIQFAGQQVADEAGGYSVSISDAELGTAIGDVAAMIANEQKSKQVALLTFPSQPNVVIRADNIKKELQAKSPSVQIVAEVPAGTQDLGLSGTETLLQKFKQLDGVVSVDAGAYGAVQALQAAGRNPGTAFVVGADAESKAVSQIKSGSIFKATVDTQPSLTGMAAMQVVGKLLAGQKVAKYTTVPVKTITG